jgi:hypothetical protein
MPRIVCHFPITVYVTGVPSPANLDELGTAVEQALARQLRLARRQLARTTDGALVTTTDASPEATDPRRAVPELAADHVPLGAARGTTRIRVRRAASWPPTAAEEAAYPADVALFSTFLIRHGYVERVAGLIGRRWEAMSDAELTAELSGRFTERQLQEQFLGKYLERAAVKSRFRKLSIISALVIGLLWARENVARGEWHQAIEKIGATTITAWLFNRLLYARDITAAAKMASAPGQFGRWFKGVARTNKTVNFLARDVAWWLLLWDLKDYFMSGGGDGPVVPFDLIVDVDIEDPSTWPEPDQLLLDLGFNIWYRQKDTPSHPEAAGGQVYLAKVEGSAVTGLLKALDIAPARLPELKDKLFQVIGPWHEVSLLITSVAERYVTEQDKVFVLATGQRSGLLVSARGHYRGLEVLPANEPAVKLFGANGPEMVPEYILRPVLR